MTHNFQEVQKNFVNSIKNPKSFNAENDDQARRMGIYQSLFFNNIDGFVSTAFPVLKEIVINEHEEKGWEALVRQFFISHECRSPYFAEISKEFVEYLSKSPQLDIDLPGFAAQLAHYEWLELDVSIRQNVPSVTYFEDSMEVSAVRVSPYASLAAYSYPVHLIGLNYLPEAESPEQQFYVVYRDQEDDVQFAHLNTVTAILIHTLEQSEEGLHINELASLLVEQLPQIPEDALRVGMNQTLNDMLKKGILLPA